MTKWTDALEKWRKDYQQWHTIPSYYLSDDEVENYFKAFRKDWDQSIAKPVWPVNSVPSDQQEKSRLEYAVFMQSLPDILGGLATESEERGIDSTPIINLRGSFSAVWRKTKKFETAMDSVWAIAQRIKLKTPATEPVGKSNADTTIQIGQPGMVDTIKTFTKLSKDEQADISLRGFLQEHPAATAKNMMDHLGVGFDRLKNLPAYKDRTPKQPKTATSVGDAREAGVFG